MRKDPAKRQGVPQEELPQENVRLEAGGKEEIKLGK